MREDKCEQNGKRLERSIWKHPLYFGCLRSRDVDARTIRKGCDCVAIDFVGRAKCRENERRSRIKLARARRERASRSRRKGIRWHYDPRRGPAPSVPSFSTDVARYMCVEKNNNVFITRARGTSRTFRQKGASPQSRMDEPVNARSPSPLGRNIAPPGDIEATKEMEKEKERERTEKGRSDFSPIVDIATAGSRKK